MLWSLHKYFSSWVGTQSVGAVALGEEGLSQSTRQGKKLKSTKETKQPAQASFPLLDSLVLASVLSFEIRINGVESHITLRGESFNVNVIYACNNHLWALKRH